MYLIALIVIGLLLVFATFFTKAKKRTKRKFVSLGIILIIAGGSGIYQTQQNSSTNNQANTKTEAKSTSQLANLNYQGQQEVEVNDNKPTFSSDDLSIANGSWQSFANLDNLNRSVQADALLNKNLMPTAKREALYVNPTGWHNKRINGGWLYNRSHLIGYQLSGQNNNPKNLMTGTRSLNAPEMLKHEDDIADYLKQNPNNYIRYRVRPIYRGNELLARGVQMMAQSLDQNGTSDNQIIFNVYIFNVEKNVNINYADGTSVVKNN